MSRSLEAFGVGKTDVPTRSMVLQYVCRKNTVKRSEVRIVLSYFTSKNRIALYTSAFNWTYSCEHDCSTPQWGQDTVDSYGSAGSFAGETIGSKLARLRKKQIPSTALTLSCPSAFITRGELVYDLLIPNRNLNWVHILAFLGDILQYLRSTSQYNLPHSVCPNSKGCP